MALKKFQKEFRIRTVGFIVTALGLVVGLAWNDAVKVFIETIFPLQGGTIIAKFIYATLLTVIVVSVIVLLMKFAEDDSDKK